MNAYLVDGIRTPIGNFGGSLSQIRADDLAALVLREILSRNTSLPPVEIRDVVFGCANQAGEDNRNVARMSLLLAGFPATVPGMTVNRLCASGMSAAIEAFRGVLSGEGDLFIAGGVEQMTRAPYVLSKSAHPFGRNAELFDTTMGWRFVNAKLKELYGTDSMGETAENVAKFFRVSRIDQDTFAVYSQKKAAASQSAGRFKEEILPVEIPAGQGTTKIFSEDEFIKPNTSLEVLTKLKPAFSKDGSVTAGNASGINDGACALLISSEAGIKKYAFNPIARFVASWCVGVEPRIMGMGPVEATKGVLAKAKLSLSDISVIELNEAFAAQSIACLRELGLSETDPRVNPNGGAIALGHPLGMSGARILLTASRELHKQNKRYALCTMCVGVGQGVAIVLERV